LLIRTLKSPSALRDLQKARPVMIVAENHAPIITPAVT
jgi:hypothetical protein